MNDKLSKDFFDKAIKSVSEIDIEAFAQIRSIYQLSQIGIVNENPQLAYDFARFIEYCDIKLGNYDKKGFPYDDGLVGIGNIDKSSMFPTLCRWHHRNVINLGGSIITLLKKAMEIGYIDHITASSLLPLKTNYNWQSLEDLYKMIIARIDITGKTEIKNKFIKFNEGEAAFAASNTNIATYKTKFWVATGGKMSRIIKGDFASLESNIYNTPFIQGESSQGIYSIDFYEDKFGIAVGGDYTKQDANVNNIATTNNGGESWQIQASGKNAGYTTCVKIKPGSRGKEIISVGDQHISYSSDFGKTWKKISDEKGFYVCQWIDGNTVVFAGKDKISLMKLKF
ncbi:hypothetical protein [uncultured Chryseobacterium sp.]|uniref:WD40/YVTN/BNR-like repeat-containing protein n=1 Tax=uncultured Chryseobacterium sp. TaxID=259322 RepID=UPI00258F8102|nr:hypothetical protein [uncultured Chryseobacterium sp.]